MATLRIRIGENSFEADDALESPLVKDALQQWFSVQVSSDPAVSAGLQAAAERITTSADAVDVAGHKIDAVAKT